MALDARHNFPTNLRASQDARGHTSKYCTYTLNYCISNTEAILKSLHAYFKVLHAYTQSAPSVVNELEGLGFPYLQLVIEH